MAPVNGPYDDEQSVERDLRNALPAEADLDDIDHLTRLWIDSALKMRVELGAVDLAAVHVVSRNNPLVGQVMRSIAIRAFNSGALLSGGTSAGEAGSFAGGPMN